MINIPKIKVILSGYKSPYYPIKATWTINNITYTAVYESIDQAKSYFNNRYYNHVLFRGLTE